MLNRKSLRNTDPRIVTKPWARAQAAKRPRTGSPAQGCQGTDFFTTCVSYTHTVLTLHREDGPTVTSCSSELVTDQTSPCLWSQSYPAAGSLGNYRHLPKHCSWWFFSWLPMVHGHDPQSVRARIFTNFKMTHPALKEQLQILTKGFQSSRHDTRSQGKKRLLNPWSSQRRSKKWQEGTDEARDVLSETRRLFL